MRLLLDTHIALWAIANPEKLSARAQALIDDRDNQVFVSVVTIWEIAIKRALGRRGAGAMPVSSAEALYFFRAAEFDLLDICPAHVIAVETLPLLHADPFDRILIAQALTEPLRLLTGDAKVAAYSDTIILV